MSQYQCPKCKSNQIRVGSPDIVCLSCGWSDPLIDFPISWGCHRDYCREFGLLDPGPCEPEQRESTNGLDERLDSVENRITGLENKPSDDYGVDYV